MENIVENLFGLTPYQVQQQQRAEEDRRINQSVQLDPFQRAAASLQRGAGMLTSAGAEAMGMVNPQVEQAKTRQAIMSQGGDLSTSVGLKAKATQFMQAGDQQTAMKLVMAAKQKEKEELAAQATQSRMALEEARIRQADAMAAKLANPPAVETKQTNDIQEYEYAKKNGYTGSFAQWMTRNAKMKSGGADGDRPPQSMLQKDQRWVQKDGQWVAEVISGTKTDQKLKGDFATDQDAYNTLVDTTKTGKAKIATILSPENASGFKSMFGGYNAKYGTQYMSGNTALVKQKLETLKSELKAAGLSIMRSGGGVGQITEKEWAIMEKLIDSIDPLMDEKDAKNVLTGISETLDTALIKGKKKFETEWADSRYANKGGAPKSGASVSDW